ncbi:MAG TPA: uL15 family ribosomal protein [Candidatus Nanoarchaeia archaeon]|nr:uL15 family ribosomal protein [Candidatus Nanoarchaeia archaeon]
MLTRKKKKVRKLRGSFTHGCGAKKKHRNAGNRGGRGMAGTGKRADQKKISILQTYGESYFGKHGFSLHHSLRKKVNAINLENLPDSNDIDLTKLGYDKLLGKGVISRKVKVIVDSCSRIAKEKIEQAGGQVILPGEKK